MFFQDHQGTGYLNSGLSCQTHTSNQSTFLHFYLASLHEMSVTLTCTHVYMCVKVGSYQVINIKILKAKIWVYHYDLVEGFDTLLGILYIFIKWMIQFQPQK
jgi:hypothetical protein